jgi:fatty-acyl-CoA synthase
VRFGADWISSVDLDNQLMAHHAIVEAAAIAIPEHRWGARPLAAVVRRNRMRASPQELREYLRSESPNGGCSSGSSSSRAATWKFNKTGLRQHFGRAA